MKNFIIRRRSRCRCKSSEGNNRLSGKIPAGTPPRPALYPRRTSPTRYQQAKALKPRNREINRSLYCPDSGNMTRRKSSNGVVILSPRGHLASTPLSVYTMFLSADLHPAHYIVPRIFLHASHQLCSVSSITDQWRVFHPFQPQIPRPTRWLCGGRARAMHAMLAVLGKQR